MLKKLPISPRFASGPINSEPCPEDSQTPNALGDSRFQKRELWLKGSDILAWDGRFSEAPLLQELRIGWSSTTYLPQDIQTLSQLKTLCILNVFLHEFPLWICEMTQLESLTVRGTNISHVPDEISKLKNLRKLDLANNLLTRFEADLREWRNLEFLAISDNDLEALPSKIPPDTALGLAGTPFWTYSGLCLKVIPSGE